MMDVTDRLEPDAARALLEQQARLQHEARQVIGDLGLIGCLAVVGRPMMVGSAATGLMVWRDIDFNILCPEPQPGPIFDALRPLVDHPALRRFRYLSEAGAFNSAGNERNNGYYCGLRYHAAGDLANPAWKIDCWFLPAGSARPEADLVARLARELTDETRLAILQIKEVWHVKPSYRKTVISVDIYTAVLDHGVRTPTGFAAWLRERGLPNG